MLYGHLFQNIEADREDRGRRAGRLTMLATWMRHQAEKPNRINVPQQPF
jgi:hypothetical protein